MWKIVLTSVSGLFALASAAPATVPVVPAAAAQQQQNHHHHMSHLARALHDTLAAEKVVQGGQKQAADAAIRKAIRQLEDAIRMHHHHYTNYANVGGAYYQHHHRHHTHLQNALHDLRAAHHQVNHGNVSKAEKDLSKAATQIRDAMNSYTK
ncbi:hypothetical protein [Fimbriiglobus ruber]|uniref:Uncharacterized protein n=1 Tax=Fimbriiglobus ruber TaxID=1908690 RepID=A0A225DJM7_9BACT|nr:hypothetical protein [Fimbriiglobus ruber]OWK36337.1 hypothetical protein FRUB_08900 [Fimbriiglobus ruber]